ncbi:GPR1/FUN34/YaaH family transporter [Opitutales bacterium ASA1]|uniref:acetate uptake transporter n=1 Tax=Congregicoccus parvus TaxID=3081749 RepID=UPI002B2FF66B|nr:GPR1/FUN34/YaaH family transporter [Opitutales bacterium ASA1]
MSSSNDSSPKTCNPAVVGLAGFGLTTLVLQLHNLGLVGLGPVIWLGLIFGGLAQFVAGIQEMKTGNNFGYCAFTSYGAFWISLSCMFLAGHFGIHEATTTDVGWFLVAWTLFTVVLWVGALRIHGAMALTFTLLLVGFVLLDLGHFGFPMLNTVAAYVLIGCALSAWYMMARIILGEIYGREVLPAGRPWVGAVRRESADTRSTAVGGLPVAARVRG